MPQVLTENDHHGHGDPHGEKYTQITIPDHYKILEHDGHTHLGGFVPKHFAFTPYRAPAEGPEEAPPTGELPDGYFLIGIPTHYDCHNGHYDIVHGYWALHEGH